MRIINPVVQYYHTVKGCAGLVHSLGADGEQQQDEGDHGHDGTSSGSPPTVVVGAAEGVD